jgi:hypothetical protein
MSDTTKTLDALRRIHQSQQPEEQSADKEGFLKRLTRYDRKNDNVRSRFMVNAGRITAASVGAIGFVLSGGVSPTYSGATTYASTSATSQPAAECTPAYTPVYNPVQPPQLCLSVSPVSQSGVSTGSSITVGVSTGSSVMANVNSINPGSLPITVNSLVVLNEISGELVTQIWNGKVVQSQTPNEVTVTPVSSLSYELTFNVPGEYNIYAIQENGYDAGYSNLAQVTVTPNAPTLTSQTYTNITPGDSVSFSYGGGGAGCTYSFAVTDQNGRNALTTLVTDPNNNTQQDEVMIGNSDTPNTLVLFTSDFAPLGSYTVTVTSSCDGVSASASSTFTMFQLVSGGGAPNVCSAAPVSTTGFGLGSEIGVINVDTTNKVIEVVVSGNPNENLAVKLTAGANVMYCDMTLDNNGNGQLNIVSNDVSFQKLNGQNVDLTLINQTAKTVIDEGNFAIPNM